MNAIKQFVKENLLLSILFVIVVGTFIGSGIYKGIKNAVDSNTKYEVKTEEVEYINRNYEVNEYKIITKDEQDLAEFYYKKIRYMWLNDPGAIYDLMSEKCKSYYDSRDAFINYINKFKSSKTASSYVDYYKVTGTNIIIMTNESVEFKLEHKGINDYKITLVAKID